MSGLPFGPETASQLAEDLGAEIRSAHPVAGGDINENFRLELDDGSSAFLKWNRDAPEGMFRAEAEGLDLLKAAGAMDPEDPTRRVLRVPRVLARRDGGEPVGSGGPDRGSYLALEWIEPGEPGREYWSALGRGLAVVHDTREGPEGPNFIGPLPQSVEPAGTWSEFWIRDRLAPQLRRAREKGLIYGGNDRAWETLLGALPRTLPQLTPEGLGLIHGDLWSGNVFPDQNGTPVLVDPAVYLGDGRVDLAMAELFGGFSTTFFQAYGRRRPPGRTYEEILRDAYQLYPLLVHVNLFGSSYVASTMDRVRRVLAALGS